MIFNFFQQIVKVLITLVILNIRAIDRGLNISYQKNSPSLVSQWFIMVVCISLNVCWPNVVISLDLLRYPLLYWSRRRAQYTLHKPHR